MIEKVEGLEFSGAAFLEKTSFPLFTSEKDRMCLIYGKNGSGKSTISRAFNKIVYPDIEEISYSRLYDLNGNTVQDSEESLRKKIFVFNEDYIRNKVSFREDGLGTIAMFGKQVELETLIHEAEADYKNAQDDREKAESKEKPFNDKNSVSSPDYYINRMCDALSGDEHWAGRERQISGNRRNASVNKTTYQSIVKNKPQKSEEELRVEYRKQYETLCSARSGNSIIIQKVNTNINYQDNEEEIRRLLKMAIEKPQLTDREKYLFSMLEEGKIAQLENMHDKFSDHSVEKCPYCFQPVSEEYKDSLVNSIEKVLSRAVENHKAELERLLISSISVDLSPFEKLDNSILNQCRVTLGKVNEAIDQVNDEIEKKIQSPYTPIELPNINISVKVHELKNLLTRLETERINYNAPLQNISSVEKDLHKINGQLAYYEIINSYNTYLKQLSEKEKAELILTEKKGEEKNAKEKLENLRIQQSSIKIAIDLINKELKYVFYSNNRLTVGTNDDKSAYTLKSNGMDVKPSDISAGERNILALCYFFVEMLDNTNEGRKFTNESLTIIDDPISSFDHENRIGIMSLLRRNTEKILSANENSKIVVMTHDLQAAFDTKRAFDEIHDIFKQHNKKCINNIFELKNRTLTEFRYRKRNEYSELLTEVYEFANGDNIENETSIGNTMRRTLEAFSTFVYKKGIEEISTCDEIIQVLRKEDIRYGEYFKSLMYRLVLNGESHSEERVRTMMDDNDFFETLTLEEKQRTAKDIICFIYLLNPLHVAAHLNDSKKANYQSVIEGWCDKIIQFES